MKKRALRHRINRNNVVVTLRVASMRLAEEPDREHIVSFPPGLGKEFRTKSRKHAEESARYLMRMADIAERLLSAR